MRSKTYDVQRNYENTLIKSMAGGLKNAIVVSLLLVFISICVFSYLYT
jgi:hypothetical protein